MASLGRLPPGLIHPSAYHPVPSSFRPVPNEYTMHTTKEDLLDAYRNNPSHLPPDYLPQPKDYIPSLPTNYYMSTLDPWATGRPDYSELANLTGVRPVVDRYSITRYSEGEWRKHNQIRLLESHDKQNVAEEVEWKALKTIDHIREETDKNQSDNTKRLNQREKEIFRWKSKLDAAIEAMTEEIELLEVQTQRLKKAIMIVLLPLSIAGECLDRRTGRLDIELVRDHVEDALTKELSLSSEIRSQLERTLREAENQMMSNRSAKHRLEFDYGDKTRAHQLVNASASLHNRSGAILYHPGAVSFQSDQSTVDLWNHFVGDIFQEAENTRKQSEEFRGTLDAVLMNAARDLRWQADSVESVLAQRIAVTDGIKQQLEIEMKKVMRRIVDAESLMVKVKEELRRLDTPLKVAHTRLYNKTLRPRVELCRDPPQYGLIDEVRIINQNKAELQSQLRQVEDSHGELMLTRSNLERDILQKRKTLEIDREILREVRSHYPSANALSGYLD